MGLGKTYSTKYLLDSNNSSGVAGQVLSTTSTGIDWVNANTVPGAGLWIESGNNIYNSNSGNVGIGTTNPVNKLDIEQSSAISARLLATGATSSSLKLEVKGGSTQLTTTEIIANSSGKMMFATGTTSSTERMTIDSSGNVGIGTINPSVKLVVSNGQKGLEMNPTGGTSDDPYIQSYNRSNNSYENLSLYASGYYFNIGSSNAMTITNSRNVGIGATAPRERLEVAGRTYIEFQGTNWNETAPGQGIGSIHLDPVGDGAANTGNAITFGASDHSNGTVADAGIYTRSDGSYGSKMYFATTDSYAVGSKTAMMIDYNGNVGIGTTSPTQKLQVEGNAWIKGIYYDTSGDAGSSGNVLTSTATGTTWVSAGTPGAGVFLPLAGGTMTGLPILGNVGSDQKIQFQRTGGNVYSIEHDASQLYFYNRTTAESPLLIQNDGDVLMNAGNVGIGTTSPQQKLHIVSTDGANIILNSNTGAENNGIWMTEGGVATPYVNGAYVHYDGSSNEFKINTGAASLSTRFTIARDTGAIKFNNYNSTNQTGTPTYLLGTDASGNVVKTNTIPGSGAGPYLPLAGGTLTGNLTGTTISLTGGITANTFRTNAGNTDYNLLTRDSTGNTLFVQAAQSNTNQPIAKFSYGSATVNAGTAVLQVSKDNSHFVNCNVGVGTTSPQVNLHSNVSRASGAFTTQGKIYALEVSNSDTTAGNAVGINFGHGGYHFTNFIASVRTGTGANPKGDLVFGGRPSDNVTFVERMRILANGNVGIGETNPTKLLEIKSTTNPVLRISNGGGTSPNPKIELHRQGGVLGNIQYSAANKVMILENESSLGGFAFNIAGSSKMVMDLNGKLGIGTTSPDAKLEVAGGLTGIILSNLGNSSAYDAVIMTYSGYNSGVPEFIFQPKTAPGSGNVNSYFRFKTQGSIGKNIANVTVDGKVGIGVTAPATKLHVQGAANDGLAIMGVGTTATRGFLGLDASNHGQMQVVSSASGGGALIKSIGVSYLNGGNVGIGTTSPGTKLFVVGNVSVSAGKAYRMYNAANNGWGEMSFVEADNRIQFNRGIQNSGVDWRLSEDSASSYVCALQGNFGIGTTSPGAKLHVKESVGSTSQIKMSAASNEANYGYLTMLDHTVNTAKLTFGTTYGYSTPVDAMTIFNGKVGIGTTDPDQKLHVAGTVKWEGVGTSGLLSGGETYVSVSQGANSYDLRLGRNNGDFTIKGDGKIGIGLTNPGSKLTVSSPLSGNGTSVDFQIDGGSGFGMKNLQVEIPNNGSGIRVLSPTTGAGDNAAMSFYQVSSQVGSITMGTSTTSFNTTSDYRLKENKEDISDAIERVKKLKPVKFNWIKEPDGLKVDGFYAHELADIVPEAVTGKKDALDHDGNPAYQAIDQSKIVPLLAAALQQAIDKIEQLEIRIQTIENN